MESYIYQYYSEGQLTEMLTAFHAVTKLQVLLIDNKGQIVIAKGKSSEFCREIIRHLPPDDSCQIQHAKAGEQAMVLGESYLFSCHADLFHIVFPLIQKKALLGSVIVGPFLMDDPDASMMLSLEKKYDIDTECLLRMSEASYKLKVISPDLAEQYSKLLYYLVNSLNTGSQEIMVANQERILQQSRISESIQMYKNSGFKEEKDYPLESESLLITKIKSGDMEEAKSILNDLLGFIMLYENHDTKRIKVRIIELCTLLSRAAIDRGAETNKILRMNEELINSLMASSDLFDICYTFQNNIDIFTESLFYTADKGNRLIKQATAFISAHFSENISLTDVADHIHLSPSYLSTLFKQVTGVFFKEYLNRVRVEEAQRLLTHTDYPIMEICIACGFSDQSYFTKVFKKFTGLTPKQYR